MANITQEQLDLGAASLNNMMLRAALRYGIGAAINELVARGMTREWAEDSGIGVMLRALGCRSLTYDGAVIAALTNPDEEE